MAFDQHSAERGNRRVAYGIQFEQAKDNDGNSTYRTYKVFSVGRPPSWAPVALPRSEGKRSREVIPSPRDWT